MHGETSKNELVCWC